jgi:hypothetical protein
MTSGDLRVSCPFNIRELTEFEFSITENTHATASFKAILDEEAGTPELDESIRGARAAVYCASETIFAGVIKEAQIQVDNGVYELTAILVSASCELDLEKRSRSFQDVGMTYSQVIHSVLLRYADADCAMVPADKPIGMPIIQYQETDWEFIKRLASHFNTSLIPETTQGTPLFWLGMPPSQATRSFYDVVYSIKSGSLSVLSESARKGYTRRNIHCFIVKSEQNCSIGDLTLFRRNKMVICGKSGKLARDEIAFRYVLGPADLIYQKRVGNERLRGCSLTGTVILAQGDKVKLHLSIDESQKPEEACWFRWAPATGNILYLMPETGTQATLYFGDSEETSGAAFTNVRAEQSRDSVGMADPRKRGLSTQHQKNLLLHDDKTGYASDSGDVSIILSDSSGMSFQTPKQIEIIANGKIQFSADTVHFFTPTNLGLYAAGGNAVPMDDDAKPVASIDFSGPTVSMFSKHGKADLKFESVKNPAPAAPKIHQRNAAVDGQMDQVGGGVSFAGLAAQDDSPTGMEATLAVAGGFTSTAAAGIASENAGGSPKSAPGGGATSMVGLKIGGKPPVVAMRKRKRQEKSRKDEAANTTGKAEAANADEAEAANVEGIEPRHGDASIPFGNRQRCLPIITGQFSRIPVSREAGELLGYVLNSAKRHRPVDFGIIEREEPPLGRKNRDFSASPVRTLAEAAAKLPLRR